MPRHKKRGRPAKDKPLTIKSPETRTFFGVVLALTGLFSILSFVLQGTFFDYVKIAVGIGAIPLGFTLFLIGIFLAGFSLQITRPRILIGLVLLTLILAGVSHFIIPDEISQHYASLGNGGGYLGYAISTFLIDTFGRLASIIILSLVATISFSLLSGITLDQIRDLFKKKLTEGKAEPTEATHPELFIGNEAVSAKHAEPNQQLQEQVKKSSQPSKPSSDFEKKMLEKVTPESAKEDTSEEPEEVRYPNWKLPAVDLLNTPKIIESDPKQHEKKAKIIEDTLQSFGIQAKVSEISVGPRVVQYALRITVGTKVSRVKSLGNDLALALAAPSGTVRIEAPIPGTSLIGIEIPSETPSLVALSEIANTPEFKEFKGSLPLCFGKDVSGKVIIKDLAKMPHILIAGATGSGKSICVNAFLCGLLMKLSPDELKLILVDSKMVELPPYNNIPHLLTPVITEIDKVVYSLEWLVDEMQSRFRILNKAGVRNLVQYNEKMGYAALPFIVFVIDEMADLMLSTGVDVESKIVRLAQMARAVGIHLVLATQRPSVDVITGLIKANIPARIGLSVATSIDSRVILDMIGAESLLGNGDMLFKAPDVTRPYRIQGAYVSNEEVEKITKFAKDQVEEVRYNEEVTKPHSPSETGGASGSGGASDDNLFPEAVRIVVHSGKASSSLLQRRLRIGYNRAARLIDELYEAKVVGPPDGSKPRDVLITDAEAFLNRSAQGDNEDI